MRIVAEAKAKVKIGDRFGMLTVIGPAFTMPSGDGKSASMCVVECECGRVEVYFQRSMVYDGKKSCGCSGIKGHSIHGGASRKTSDQLYKRWSWMKQRCLWKRHPDYHSYGGRGIAVCDEWVESFVAFRDWAMSNGYSPELTIDREDVDGPYSPKNCRWVENKVQQRNRRNNRTIEAFGESKLGCEWCEDERCAVPGSVFWNRLHRGWDAEDALTKPIEYRRPRKPRKQTQDGR